MWVVLVYGLLGWVLRLGAYAGLGRLDFGDWWWILCCIGF